MNRRLLLAGTGTALCAAAFDTEAALWVPGKKVISVPAASNGVYVRIYGDNLAPIFPAILKAHGNPVHTFRPGLSDGIEAVLWPTNRSTQGQDFSALRDAGKFAKLFPTRKIYGRPAA